MADAPIDALDAAVVALGELIDEVARELPLPAAIDVGRAAPPAPRFAPLEHV